MSRSDLVWLRRRRVGVPGDSAAERLLLVEVAHVNHVASGIEQGASSVDSVLRLPRLVTLNPPAHADLKLAHGAVQPVRLAWLGLDWRR